MNQLKQQGYRWALGVVFAACFSGAAHAQAGDFPNATVSLHNLGEYLVRANAAVNLARIETVNQASQTGGFSKDDVHRELGKPTEGGIATDNWYYVFNLDLRSGDKLACQYRASFQTDELQSTAWRRHQCQTAYTAMRDQAAQAGSPRH